MELLAFYPEDVRKALVFIVTLSHYKAAHYLFVYSICLFTRLPNIFKYAAFPFVTGGTVKKLRSAVQTKGSEGLILHRALSDRLSQEI